MTNQNPTYKDKLTALRAIMKEQGVDGFVVPRADEYQGEFVAAYAERLKWLTGFTGSGGAAVVLADKAAVLTDGRYIIQVKRQVESALFETADITEVSAAEWVETNAEASAVIGYDPWLLTPKQLEKFEEKDIKLKALDMNLIDEVWADQPAPPVAPVEIFPENYAGRSSRDKRLDVARKLKAEELDATFITLPDSIAWLLNIRGGDVDYIPVALSYALIKNDGTLMWFIDPAKLSPVILDHLGPDVEVAELSALGDLNDQKIGLDFKSAPAWFKDHFKVVDFKDPCIAPKAIKTPEEQDAIKAAHIRDGAALVEFLFWLDEHAPKGELRELDIAKKLRECRAAHAEFRGPSFPTIAGFGANGAIVHYRATAENNDPITPPGFLLVDSGGQYIDGTTDITRTIVIGEVTDEMKRHFTLVLKGHIALATARFKPGTLGKEIDALARAPLQAEGLDYAHGTGHGVGCYLAVHEAAANLSPKGENAVKFGMLLSNEPGYYQQDSHGIRTENLVLAQQDGDELYFETVSLAPIDRRAIDVSLLEQSEIDWLNAYHMQVWDRLKGLLPEAARLWLKAQTEPV